MIFVSAQASKFAIKASPRKLCLVSVARSLVISVMTVKAMERQHLTKEALRPSGSQTPDDDGFWPFTQTRTETVSGVKLPR